MLKRNYIVPVVWLTLLLLTANNFFFWDTVQLASKQASFFYDNNFSAFFLPDDINSGHPPFYGLALAFIWTIIGKSLLSSHIFNALFVLGFIFQAHKLGHFLVGKELAFFGPLVLFCNPIFLGHSILVSPDNALCFLVLWMVNGLLRRNLGYIIFSSILLCILSMRGMMTVASVALAELIYWIYISKKLNFRAIVKYIPAGIIAFAFLLSHYLYNQWLGYHSDSPWQESFQLVNLQDYLKNLIIICWRLVDFGNIFIVLPLLALVLFSTKKIPNIEVYFSLLLGFVIIFIIPLAGFKYLSGHRYFMPIYLIASFMFIDVFAQFKYRKYIITASLILLFLGNWWIYPRSISQGWDVSLGHLPFYSLVEEMNLKIKERGIISTNIGTEFPLKTDSKYLYLDETKPGYHEGVIGKDQFILYSKVINDYKDTDWEILKNEYKLIEDLNLLFIDLKLYEKR